MSVRKFVSFFVMIVFLAFANEVTAQSVQPEVAEAAEENVENKKKSVWKTLTKITFKKEYNEIMGFKVDVPVFSDEVKALSGQEVVLKGYIIPVEGYKSHKEFIFSAFPYNMCFFCGGAGPETVMEVESLDAVKFTSESIWLRGKLKLNADDINNLMYKLVDAQLVKK